jgi:transposase
MLYPSFGDVLIDRHIDFTFVRENLKASYSDTGRPSIDPEVLLRILLIGCLYEISSERCLVEDIGMHLAYRWFIGLGFDQDVPHHSTFSKNRHGRFQESALFLDLFERVIQHCMNVGLLKGTEPSVDSEFAYYDNYLIDSRSSIIAGVMATPARLSQEIIAARQMLEGAKERFGLQPVSVTADKSYGTGEFLSWLSNRQVTPYIPVLDRKQQTKGFHKQHEFTRVPEENAYRCPAGRLLRYMGLKSRCTGLYIQCKAVAMRKLFP